VVKFRGKPAYEWEDFWATVLTWGWLVPLMIWADNRVVLLASGLCFWAGFAWWQTIWFRARRYE